jgi:hypothetical protein
VFCYLASALDNQALTTPEVEQSPIFTICSPSRSQTAAFVTQHLASHELPAVIVAAHLGTRRAPSTGAKLGQLESIRYAPPPEERSGAPTSRRGRHGREILSRRFAQKIGISLAGLGKLDDALGDDLINAVASVGKVKGRANHHRCRHQCRHSGAATRVQGRSS